MSQLGKFFVKKDQVVSVFNTEGEQPHGYYKSILYEDATNESSPISIKDLDLQVTSHRLEFTTKSNAQLCFLVKLETVNQIKFKEGWFIKTHLNLYTNDKGKLRMYADKSVLQKIQKEIELSLKQKEWKRVTQKQQVEQQKVISSGMYQGTKQIHQKEHNEIKQNESQFQSGFQGGDLKSLFANMAELKQITDYIKANSEQYKTQNNSEVDQLLEGIGIFEAVTKEGAGKEYLNKLSEQIYNDICRQLFESYGGIIPLIDIYYFYNKRRGALDYISAKEVEDACKNFRRLNLQAQVVEYGNVKVVESTTIQQTFELEIGQYIQKNGISPEELSKVLNQNLINKGKKNAQITAMIARIKLQKALQQGHLVIDDRIEGVRYYNNHILKGF